MHELIFATFSAVSCLILFPVGKAVSENPITVVLLNFLVDTTKASWEANKLVIFPASSSFCLPSGGGNTDKQPDEYSGSLGRNKLPTNWVINFLNYRG